MRKRSVPFGRRYGKISFLPLYQFEQFSDAAPIVECEKCDGNYCYKDKIVWSANHDCNDYGNATGKLPENVKPCPTCGARVSFLNSHPSTLHRIKFVVSIKQLKYQTG